MVEVAERSDADLLDTMQLLERMRVLEQQKGQAGVSGAATQAKVPTTTEVAPLFVPSPFNVLASAFRGEQRLPFQGGAPPEGIDPTALTTQAAQTSGVGRAVTSAISGAAGAPGDILNLPGAVSTLVGGPDFRLPIGSDSIARGMGLDPLTMNALERSLQTVSGAITPGLFLKIAISAGILPKVAESLYKYVSAGPRGDVIMGTASAGGAEAGRLLTRHTPTKDTPEQSARRQQMKQQGYTDAQINDAFTGATGPLIGGVAGPLTAVAIRAGISSGIKNIGRPLMLKQEAEEAEKIALRTQSESDLARREAAERMQQGKDIREQAVKTATESKQLLDEQSAARIQQIQDDVSAAKARVDTAKARGTLDEKTVMDEIAAINADAKRRIAEERHITAQQLRAGRGVVAQAEGGVAETFVPLQQEIGQEILKTRTVAGTPRVIPQIPPGTREAGEAIQTSVKTGQIQVRAELADEGIKTLEAIGPALAQMDLLGKTRQFFRETFFKQGRENLGKLFDATEQVTGDVPVVSLGRLHERAKQEAHEATRIGQVSPRGTHVFSATDPESGAPLLGVAKEELEQLLTSDVLSTKPLTDTQKQLVQTILADPKYEQNLLPFFLARRLESALNEIAYRGAAPIGTITQGKARRYVAALQDDLHDFYLSDIATTRTSEIEAALQPFGGTTAAEPSIAGALPLAREKYREFIQTTNHTIVSKILSNDETVQRQFLRPFTTPRGETGALLDIKKVAAPEVWEMLGAFTLAEGHRIASTSGQFDLGKMHKWLLDLRASGKMDILFTPEQVADIERYSGKLVAESVGDLPALKARLTRMAPEKVAPFAFQPGEITLTQNVKAVLPEETFDLAVKAFAADLMNDALTMTPEALHKKYAPMVRRDRIGGGIGHGGGESRSQLDIMLTEYPGESDKIKLMFDSLTPRQLAVERARARVETMKEGGKEALAALKEREAASLTTKKRELKTLQDVIAQETESAQLGVETLQTRLETSQRAETQQKALRAQRLAELQETSNEAAERARRMHGQFVQEEKDLVDFANEQMRIYKKAANIPDEYSVYAYWRTGPAHIRASATGTTMIAGGLVEAAGALLAGQPLWALLGIGAAGGVYGLQRFTGWAYTDTGKRIIRQGLQGQWAPSSARWAAGALAIAEEESTTPEPTRPAEEESTTPEPARPAQPLIPPSPEPEAQKGFLFLDKLATHAPRTFGSLIQRYRRKYNEQ